MTSGVSGRPSNVADPALEAHVTKLLVEKDSYFDSVFLMLINREVKQFDGVEEAVVSMATEMNMDLLKKMGISGPELSGTTPNDLVVAVVSDSESVATEAIAAAQRLLHQKKSESTAGHEYQPPTLDAAVRAVPDANLVVISLPGQYAAREALKALNQNLHVMLFSDNVSLEDEIRLKKFAAERGLLMMGPDCGTAILNSKPICFANVIRRGNIGIVAAAGTGLQEVSCAISRFGGGVTQGIGTGGRDLSAAVGGIMMLMGIEALANDPDTAVITVVSKPPADEVAAKVIDALSRTGKPCVVDFVGMGERAPEGLLQFATSLEDAAARAVALSAGREYTARTFTLTDPEVDRIVEREVSGMNRSQKYLRGLFTGGTLADEAMVLIDTAIGGVYSNNQKKKELLLKDAHVSTGHTIVDLGDDVFTVGRPHPMIDPSTREERIVAEAEDPDVAVMLLDLVLGYGSHPDPAGAILESLKTAKEKMAARGGYLSIIASITGTEGDYQNMDRQKRVLESSGCVVMPSNFQASMLALKILEAKKP
jgi:succinyl-CoA synthetase alpha subunit